MRTFMQVVCIAAALSLMTGCGRKESKTSKAPARTESAAPAQYPATLQEGIQFSREGLPDFVESVIGLSGTEAWGRWSDSPVVRITFKGPLPNKFALELVGGAFGPNMGKPARVVIGSYAAQVIFSKAPYGKDAETRRLAVELREPASVIEITIPQPTAPGGGDNRNLGLGLVRLSVVPQT